MRYAVPLYSEHIIQTFQTALHKSLQEHLDQHPHPPPPSLKMLARPTLPQSTNRPRIKLRKNI
jgi:hypothetical protein